MTVKGWCPGAYRPMMSGDGLIVRVRPRKGHMTAAQTLGLCDLSHRFGNGVIDLTSRANLQLRGIREDTHQRVLEGLLGLDILDESPEKEHRRNIVMTPLWSAGDINARLHDALCAALNHLPDLPAKMGFAIDAGNGPVLQNTSADFRFEKSAEGGLILRLDGTLKGRAITEDTAIAALIAAARWFVETGGPTAKRVAHHVHNKQLPKEWVAHAPAQPAKRLAPGRSARGACYGAPFGSMDARALSVLLKESAATAMQLTPWRVFVLEHAQPCPSHGFVTDPQDPVLSTHACPGAPACGSATTETREIARALAPLHRDGLHVSGCAKGCAFPKPCATTLVGRDGAYDLVEQGHPWDQPRQRGLSRADLTTIKA
ncbi:MAG: cobalamin biosynthesis protein CobG [Pseudomonadota bacterium]